MNLSWDYCPLGTELLCGNTSRRSKNKVEDLSKETSRMPK